MNKVMLGLMAACLILNQVATAQKDCQEDKKKMTEAVKETLKSNPSCIKDLQLEEWQCSEDDDEVQAEEKHKEFLIWMKEQPEEDQKAIAACVGGVFEETFARVEGDMDPECVKMFKEKMVN